MRRTLLVVALLLAGCSGAESTLEDQEAVEAAPKMMRGGPPGPDRLSMVALEDLELTDAQRAAIEATMAPSPPPSGHGPKQLAAAIRAGSVDPDALGPSDAERAAMEKAHRAHAVKALSTLHDTLSSAQRAALVAAMEERKEERGARPPHAGRGHHGPPLEMLLRDVELKDGQREKIEAALADVAPKKPSVDEMKAHRAKEKALLLAFARDSFDADAALAEVDAGRDHGPPPFIEALAVIVPMLDADQREALAASIEKGPPMGGPRPEH